MPHQSHAVLHPTHHLLPHPLGYQVVAQHDDGGGSQEPQGVEREEKKVESTLGLCKQCKKLSLYKINQLDEPPTPSIDNTKNFFHVMKFIPLELAAQIFSILTFSG